MKKIVLGLFILLSSFVLLFTGVKTKAVSAPVMVTGASIRATGERQGLKFSATVDSLDGVTEHGFYVALGTHTQSEMATAINSDANSVGGKKLKKVEVTGEDTTFHAVIYNIPEASYGQVITAIAYVSDGSTKTLSSEVMTRNIADIARGLYNTTSTYDEDNNQVYTVANASRIKVIHSDSSINYCGSFASFSLAAGDTIELAKGTYSENVTISVNNVTVNGINSGVHYDEARNLNESVMSGNITIAANTTNCTIDGLKFEGTSKVTTSPGSASTNYNNDCFIFRNNIVETNLASGNGFIFFDENDSNGYSQNLTFSNNYFKCVNGSSTLSSLLYLENNIGLVINNNKFENAPNKAVYIQDTDSGKGMAGDLTLTNNIFTSVGTNGFDVNWFSPYGGATNKEIAITNNTFTSITGQALRLYKANASDSYASFNITNNTFTSVGTGLYSARIKSTYKIKFNNNIFNTRPTTAYAQVDELNDGVKLNARYNLFKESEVVVLPNGGKYDSAKIDIFAPTSGAPTDKSMKIGSTYQLDSSNLGLNMAGTIVLKDCTSDNEDIATVSETGLITAVAAGETDIHVKVTSYSDIPLTIHVEVVDGIIGTSAVLVGGTSTYDYAGSGTKEWSTTNSSIATIDEDGELTALAYGEIEVVLTVNSVEIDRLEVLITPNEFYVDDNWSIYSNGDQITYNAKKYVKGLNAFHTISSSIAANRTINVLAGSYSDAIDINVANVTILGPYESVLGTGARTNENEAIISNTITISANNTTLKGIKFTGSGKAITWSTEISNLRIENIISDATTGIGVNGNGRNTIIGSDSDITGLVIKGIKLTRSASSTGDALAIFGVVEDLTLEDNYISNGATTTTSSEAIRINKIAGEVIIERNEIIWSTSNYSVFLGNVSNNCTSMTFCNNVLKGGTASSTTLGFWYMNNNCEAYIIGNYFDKFDSGTTISFSKSTSATVDIKYNYFGSGVHYKWANVSGVTQTYSGNYYAATQTTATTDYNVIQSLDGLITAYKDSAEYTSYGSICIYED